MESQPQLRSFFTAEKDHYLFHFDLSPDSPPRRVDIALEARTRLEEALSIAIDALNPHLAKEGLRLGEELSLYRPRLVGRNFRPKTDMPALALHQKICDLKVTEIAVQLLNREKALRPLVPEPRLTQPDTNADQSLTAKAQPLRSSEKAEPVRKEGGAAAVGEGSSEREAPKQEERDKGKETASQAQAAHNTLEGKSQRGQWSSTTTELAVKAAELSARAAQKAAEAAQLACEAQQLAAEALQIAIQAAQQTQQSSWSS